MKYLKPFFENNNKIINFCDRLEYITNTDDIELGDIEPTNDDIINAIVRIIGEFDMSENDIELAMKELSKDNMDKLNTAFNIFDTKNNSKKDIKYTLTK